MRNMKLLLELCLLWTFLGVLTSHEISYEYHGNEQSDEQAIDHQQESAADHGEADMSNDLFPAQPPSTGNTPQEVHNGPNSRRNNLFNMTEEEERRWRIDMIKLQLLAQIDDLALPNMTVPVLPKPLRYRDEPVIQRDQPDQPKISQVVFFADPVRSHVESDGGIHIFFNLDSTYSYKNTHSVELWLYKQRSQRNHTYIVSKHSDHHYHGNNNRKPVILASERVSIKPGWVEFNDMTLRDKIMCWVNSIGHMLITCPTCDEGEVLPIVTEGDKKPFLVINFKKINKRYKRHAEWCSENQGSCCKKMFKFNFHAEGLNMFLKPREYQPNYCQGSCVFRQFPVRSHVERDGGIHIFFNLDSTYSYKHIHSVELWLYKQSSQRNHTYIVSRHSNQNHRGNNNGKPVILASERVSVKPGWVEFKDMTLRDKIMRWVTMVRRFPEQSSSNGHMLITCPTCDEGVALPIVTEGDKKPFLVINFKKINKRYKRHAEWCSENQGSCCKKMFKFNFHAEGLNMFVEPREYQPNYCQGSCVVRHFPETIHMASGPYVSVIMQSAAFQKRGKEPCCAPNKLTSTTVLYYNRNMHMVRKTLENMVVESCGCH